MSQRVGDKVAMGGLFVDTLQGWQILFESFKAFVKGTEICLMRSDVYFEMD